MLEYQLVMAGGKWVFLAFGEAVCCIAPGNIQIPPDFVVKSQSIDIAEVIA
jgi:hypothetical protein